MLLTYILEEKIQLLDLRVSILGPTQLLTHQRTFYLRANLKTHIFLIQQNQLSTSISMTLYNHLIQIST